MDEQDLQRRLEGLLTETRVPGAVCVVRHREAVTVAASGVTNVDHPLDVDATTLFQIGSITKPTVATAVVRLAADGLVDLDAPVRAVLPKLRLADDDVAARVTPRHLLTHHAGWAGLWFADFGRGADALERYVEAMVDLPQQTPLDAFFAYSNTSYTMLGRVIEVASGMTFEQAMHELVFAPLAMDLTFLLPEDALGHRVAAGHAPTPGGPAVLHPWYMPRTHAPAAGLVTCARDLLRFASFHLDGGSVLPDAARREMHTPQRPAAKQFGSIGLGWMVRDWDGVRFVSHGGFARGQMAFMTMAPEDRFAVAVLTNAGNGPAVARPLARSVVQECLGIEQSEPSAGPLPPEIGAEYTGRYESAVQDVEATIDGDELVLVATPRPGQYPPGAPPPPPVRLGMVERDWLQARSGPPQGAEFMRRDGAVHWLSFNGIIHTRA